MKSIYLFFLLATVSLNLFCQEETRMVKDSARAYFWNSETNSWIYHVRYVFRYDTKGNLIDNYWYNGMSNDELLSEYYVSYSYDSSGNQIEKIWYDWGSESNNWIYRTRIVYAYDNSGNLTEEITYKWDSESNEWKVYGLWCDMDCIGGRKEYSYDSTGLKKEINWYDWNPVINMWVKKDNWYHMNVYDTNMNLIEECRNTYMNTCTYFQYDEYGNLVIQINSFDTLDLLMDTIHYSNIYDENGYLTEKIKYRPNTESQDTTWLDRDVFEYDANGYQTESYSYNWDSETRDWYKTWKDVYYWSLLSTQIPNNIIDLNYIVYPNPFTDYTTIELSDAVQTQKIELIDIHGSIVKTIEKVNSNSVTIHRDNLPGGIYIIRILSDDTYVRKVIIR